MRAAKRKLFPDFITSLPPAEIPMAGVKAHLLQGENQQVVLWTFGRKTEVAEHSHATQWGVVIKGRMEMTIEGKKLVVRKGDTYYVPKGARHSAIISKGYSDVTFFGQKDRYKTKARPSRKYIHSGLHQKKRARTSASKR